MVLQILAKINGWQDSFSSAHDQLAWKKDIAEEEDTMASTVHDRLFHFRKPIQVSP